MSSNSRVFVFYKDGKNDRSRCYGPFVSASVAEFFQACLPDPLPGGFNVIKPVEPFTAQDGPIVRELLLRRREQKVAA